MSTGNSLKVDDVHQKHNNLDDREDDHGQRRRADGHLFFVRTVRLIALQWLWRWHHIPAISGQHIAYHPLVVQRHGIELVKVQVPIVVHVAPVQYLLGNVRRYVPAVAIRYETFQLVCVDKPIPVRVVLHEKAITNLSINQKLFK